MTTHFILDRLRLSLLWFTLLAAILSTLFALILAIGNLNQKEITLAIVLATSISSPLLWWLFIVRPRQVTAVRGVLAGIFSVILAVFLMLVIVGILAGGLFLGEEAWLKWLLMRVFISVVW